MRLFLLVPAAFVPVADSAAAVAAAVIRAAEASECVMFSFLACIFGHSFVLQVFFCFCIFFYFEKSVEYGLW